ncbi:Tyrosine-protein phosphatase CDC14 [Pseudozyma hubeiensis]|nr:Tyrosine-protein phosphatase CDC14 [Pseudozyma hubeiensis]
MASTSAFVLQETHEHIIAPDDSDFLDSDAESSSTPHPDDHLIESAVLEDLHHSPANHGSSSRRTRQTSPHKLYPAHPLIRIHKRLWFTYFSGDLPSEDDLNEHDGQPSAWKNFDDAEIKKYVDPAETNPARLHWFNIDHDLVYLSFWFDWGPLNVGMFYRFCLHVHHMLTDPEMQDATLVLYTTDAPAQKANAALLVTLYAMIIGKVSPADAFYPISELEFKPFRDAGYGRADYNLSIQDILYGVHRAINTGLLDLTTFNLDEYEKYEQVSNGDWNWITPNFIAFASPNDRSYVEALRVGEGRLPSSYSFRPPGEDKLFGKTIRYFKDRGVKLVVRLNNPLYDREAFLNAGIDHSDMYFDDGSNPTDEILIDFIDKADKVIQQDGVVAVHCKAGLGRTGVLIGAYLVWKHGFSAGEAIGFMRFMRPGCVVGPQQHFMYQNFVEWIKWGVRDHAMKEARELVEAERRKIEASAAAAAAATATVSMATPKRASVKRRAVGSDAAKGDDDDSFDRSDADVSLDDDVHHAQGLRNTRKKSAQDSSDDSSDESQPPRQKQKPSSSTVPAPAAEPPVTPKAQRGTSRAIPASAAPVSKPAPCVGQPRKSPSPSRKRPAIQAPATVARLELNSKRYPAATRSFNNRLMLSSHATLAAPVHVDDPVVGEVESEVEHVDQPGAAAALASASPGVLVESRINVSTTPRTSPKAPSPATTHVTPISSSTPVARVRTIERSRSNTIATTTVVATPPRSSSRPDAKPEVFRASPSVRERFGLKDSSNGGGMNEVEGTKEGRSDAEVLGVIECIPQVSPGVRRYGSISPVRVAKVERAVVEEGEGMKVEGDGENVRPGAGAVVRAPLTAGVGKGVRTVKTPVPSASSSARIVTARKPISARPTTTTTGATQRSVSAKLQPSTSTARVAHPLRTQKSTADIRTTASSSSTAPPVPRVNRTVSSSSNSSTTATTGATVSRPGSRLTAPTAASAARAAASAAAAVKRTTTPTTRPQVVAAGMVRKTSGKVAGGAVRRSRRSSTGEAGLDVVA